MFQAQTKALQNGKPMIRALQGHKDHKIPFWFMRQAGRYLPEYRELRQKAGSFLDLCFNPEMAAEVTLQPLRRFDMDAAILFSDILVIPMALGQELAFMEGEGPRLGELDIEGLAFSNEKLMPVYQTIKLVREGLAPDKTLIGFAGAPWTVACYMVEGRGTGHFSKTIAFAKDNEKAFSVLIEKITSATIEYLSEQARSGAEVLQLFDSWAGLLPDGDFERWVTGPTKRICEALKQSHPDILLTGFPRGAKECYISYANETGVDCIGLDQDISVSWAVKNISGTCALQGNLDPALLLQGGKEMEEAALKILVEAQDRSLVFNLGHGIVKETPPENVALLSDIVKGYSR